MSLESTDSLSAEQLSRLLAVRPDGSGRRKAAPIEPAPAPPRAGQDTDDCDGEPGPFSPGQVVGDFEIIEEIGRGGMCIVYKASQRGLRREVALKALRPSLAQIPAVARRFRRESVLAANLRHPNIVPIFSHGLDGAGRPYFTMELVDGVSIARRVARTGAASSAAVLHVAIEACDALGAAHEAGIIHRDVTPRNIILQKAGRVRLLDFGIAQDTTGALAGVTRSGPGSSGTLAFMSPEQNLGRRLDARGDIFSLGMTLYYMLTGTTAYRASNRAELALAFQLQRPRPPGDLRPAAGGPLGRIVMKMIAVDPGERYRNCDELAADLAACGAFRRGAGALPPRPPARAATAAALLAAAALAAYAWGPMACRSNPPGRGRTALAPPPATRPRPPERAGRAAQTALAAGRRPRPATKPRVRPAPGPAPTTIPPAKPAAKPAAAPPARPEPPQAVVQWVYQPREGMSFNDAGALKGRTTLADDNRLSLGLFLFDPVRGLVPYSPRNGPTADFQIQIDRRKVRVRRVAQPDGSGCLLLAAQDAFATPAPPQRGYQWLYEHTLKAEMVLLFRCASGGYAKMRVVSVE